MAVIVAMVGCASPSMAGSMHCLLCWHFLFFLIFIYHSTACLYPLSFCFTLCLLFVRCDDSTIHTLCHFIHAFRPQCTLFFRSREYTSRCKRMNASEICIRKRRRRRRRKRRRRWHSEDLVYCSSCPCFDVGCRWCSYCRCYSCATQIHSYHPQTLWIPSTFRLWQNKQKMSERSIFRCCRIFGFLRCGRFIQP